MVLIELSLAIDIVGCLSPNHLDLTSAHQMPTAIVHSL